MNKYNVEFKTLLIYYVLLNIIYEFKMTYKKLFSFLFVNF